MMNMVQRLSERLLSLYAVVAAFCVQLYLALFVSSSTAQQPVLIPAHARRSSRGAGMLEYSLVALISIGVFWVLKDQFSDILGSLAKKIGDALSGINGNDPAP